MAESKQTPDERVRAEKRVSGALPVEGNRHHEEQPRELVELIGKDSASAKRGCSTSASATKLKVRS